MPELYIQKGGHAGLQYAITDPLASVCGSNFYANFTPPELMFVVGAHLSYYCPEHYIRWVEPTTAGLRLLLLAAIKSVNPAFQTPPDPSGCWAS